MKAIDLIQALKRREHRPAILIAVGVVAYLVVVSWPEVLGALGHLWKGKPGAEGDETKRVAGFD